METAPSRRNDAQNRALSFPSLLVKRRPKAAVQAFKDSQNKKSAFPMATHSLAVSSHKTDTAFFCFSPLDGEAPSLWGDYAEEGIGACLAFLFITSRLGRSVRGEMSGRD